ncbi:MAG: DUF2079 domain-containing protein [Bdellovibrionota bacterium]
METNSAKQHERRAPSVGEVILALGTVAFPGFVLAALCTPGVPSYLARFSGGASIAYRLGASLALSAVIILAVAVTKYKRTQSRNGVEAWFDFSRFLVARYRVLLVLPFLLALLCRGIEREAPYFTLFLIGVVALFCADHLVRRSAEGTALLRLNIGKPLSLALVIAGAAGTAWQLISASLFNFQAQYFSSQDLALYENMVWHTARGDLFQSSLQRARFAAHVEPIIALFAPFHYLFPGAKTLIVLQALWVCSGAIPAWLLARTVLKDNLLAALCAFVYLLHPGIHGAVVYEFHSFTLIAPTVIWLLYFVETGSTLGFCLSFVIMLLTREDAAFIGVGIGLFLIASPQKLRWGLGAISASVAYFVLLKLALYSDPGVFMEDSASSIDYSWRFQDLIPASTPGFRGMLLTLVANPLVVVRVMLRGDKPLFFLQLLLPFLFIPLVSGRRMLALLYGFALCFLSSAPEQYSLYRQYNIALTPLLCALFPFGLAKLEARRRSALALSALVASVLVSAKFGAWYPNDAFQVSGWPSIHFKTGEEKAKLLQTSAALQEILPLIPADASVAASHGLLPYIADRRRATIFPLESELVLVRTDAIATDRRPFFEEQIANHELELIAKRDSIELYRRTKPPRGSGL